VVKKKGIKRHYGPGITTVKANATLKPTIPPKLKKKKKALHFHCLQYKMEGGQLSGQK